VAYDHLDDFTVVCEEVVYVGGDVCEGVDAVLVAVSPCEVLDGFGGGFVFDVVHEF